MSQGIHEGATVYDAFYQCKSCSEYVTCPIMPGSKEMEGLKKKGSCPDYNFNSTTKMRRGFK